MVTNIPNLNLCKSLIYIIIIPIIDRQICLKIVKCIVSFDHGILCSNICCVVLIIMEYVYQIVNTNVV